MPKYEFKCEGCGKSFEVMLTLAERAATTVQCPNCASAHVTSQMTIFAAKTSKKS